MHENRVDNRVDIIAGSCTIVYPLKANHIG